MKFSLQEKAKLSEPLTSLTCVFRSEFVVGDTYRLTVKVFLAHCQFCWLHCLKIQQHRVRTSVSIYRFTVISPNKYSKKFTQLTSKANIWFLFFNLWKKVPFFANSTDSWGCLLGWFIKQDFFKAKKISFWKTTEMSNPTLHIYSS